MFNSFITKEEGVVKMVDDSACEVIDTEQSRLVKEMGYCALWKKSGMFRRHDTI